MSLSGGPHSELEPWSVIWAVGDPVRVETQKGLPPPSGMGSQVPVYGQERFSQRNYITEIIHIQ